MDNSVNFLLGCLGGLLPDLLRIIRNRYEVNLPAYFKNFNFWLGFVLLVLVGGVTAWILKPEQVKDAIIYGYASPAILSQLAASASPPQVEKDVRDVKETVFKLLGWWRS